MKKNHRRSRQFCGFLESGTSFTGQLRFEGTLRVDGNVSGSVVTPDVLVVGPSATVRADVTAGALQILGRVVGDVSCSERVEILSGGRLEGDVRTPHLVIEEGGVLNGRSQTAPADGETARAVTVDTAAHPEPARKVDACPEPARTVGPAPSGLLDEVSEGPMEREDPDEAPRSAYLRMSHWRIRGKKGESADPETVTAGQPDEE